MKLAILAILLAGCTAYGCAYISGPCKVQTSDTSSAAECEAGGVLSVVPAPKLPGQK